VVQSNAFPDLRRRFVFPILRRLAAEEDCRIFEVTPPGRLGGWVRHNKMAPFKPSALKFWQARPE